MEEVEEMEEGEQKEDPNCTASEKGMSCPVAGSATPFSKFTMALFFILPNSAEVESGRFSISIVPNLVPICDWTMLVEVGVVLNTEEGRFIRPPMDCTGGGGGIIVRMGATRG